RANLDTLVIERGAYGGNIFQTSEIENYPGGMPAETGAEFSARIEAQAEAFGMQRAYGNVSEAELEGPVKKIVCGDTSYLAKAVVIATGTVPTALGFEGEKEFTGMGVSYCAVCDGPFFSGKDVFVIGGGDAAVDESMHLSKFCRKVTVVHRRDEFRAAKSIVDKAAKIPNIEFLMDTVIVKAVGDGMIETVVTENVKTGEQQVFTAREGENFGVFVFVGMKPQTDIFKGVVDMEGGYIVTDEKMRTNVPGVFAAGDVRKKSLRQVVTATADGAIAAVEAEAYIVETGC
ncbi:MAG: FAD-dependent oxidoreductase, partial [Clostridiales Family XIII bacterium]|nr:FAD-dependent oxidoreductase [Clostridiales Family XIII bacterium]